MTSSKFSASAVAASPHYEDLVEKRLGKRGFTDLFWPDVLLVEQKSAGRNLDEAYDQAGDYFDGMNGGPYRFSGISADPPFR